MYYSLLTFLLLFQKKNIIFMPKIPEDKRKVKISISIDSESNIKLEKLTIDKKFYKKSRLIDFIIKKYLEENDN